MGPQKTYRSNTFSGGIRLDVYGDIFYVGNYLEVIYTLGFQPPLKQWVLI